MFTRRTKRLGFLRGHHFLYYEIYEFLISSRVFNFLHVAKFLLSYSKQQIDRNNKKKQQIKHRKSQ